MADIPKIRFKGFTEPWEQRKLGEFVNNVAKKNKDNLDLEPFAVTNDRGFIAQKDAHDDFGYMNNVDRTAYNIVPPNSFAYNPARINVGSLGYYSGTENVIVSSLYEVFQTADYVDDKFLWHWFKSDLFPKWIERLQEGSVRLYFYFDKLIQCEMEIPSLVEQQKIGEYLDTLDHLITLHQRKCDDTKELKKYMLQKMFPKNGEKFPEIRFKGFTEAWEQRKLGEVCNITTGKLDANAMNIDGQFDFYTSGIDIFKIDTAAFEGPAITIAGNGASVGYMHLADGKFNAYQRTYVLTDFSTDRYFLNVAIGKKLPYKIQEEVRGSGIPYIVLNMLTDLEIPFPDNNEQRKIGAYFTNLDHLITLHQRKCDTLKELKKYMLQNMFPKKG